MLLMHASRIPFLHFTSFPPRESQRWQDNDHEEQEEEHLPHDGVVLPGARPVGHELVRVGDEVGQQRSHRPHQQRRHELSDQRVLAEGGEGR